MKNRKNMIVAFLLCACLIVGIGYAQVTGTLTITGSAKFNGAEELSSEIKDAIKFSNATAGENCDSATIVNDDAADMTVALNDAVGNAATFNAYATYEISYDTTDTTYPEVAFALPNATITSSANKAGWSITVVYQNPSDGVIVSEDGSTVTLVPGGTVDAYVTVSFDNNADGEVFKDADTASISVMLNYATVAE